MNFKKIVKKIVSSTLISSLIVLGVSFTSTYAQAENSSWVKFYQDSELRGNSTQPIGAGNYTLDQLQKYGFKNDWASSVYIPEDYVVLMYENDNFNGIPWVLTQNDDNSRDFTKVKNNILQVANDKVSSIKVCHGVCFYEDINYGGTSWNPTTPGYYDFKGLLRFSSVIIPKGWSVHLYGEGDTRKWFLAQNDENSRNFDRFGANDKVATYNAYKGVVFFTEANYGGYSMEGGGFGPGDYYGSNLRSTGSVYIPEGYKVQIFEYSNFQGNSWTLDRNDENSKNLDNLPGFHNFILGNTVGSFKVTRNY